MSADGVLWRRANAAEVIPLIPTLCVVLALSAATPAFADIRILGSTGGEVGAFLKLFEVLRESGERIVIDGLCYSACTLVLSTVPRERICVTRRAVLGFHGARLFDYEGNEYTVPPSLNAAVAEAYPEPVKRWIARRGGLTRKLIVLRGAELYRHYPRCS
jgi:hypothetical protein